MLRFPRWPLPFRFLDRLYTSISHLSHACDMSRPSYFYCVDSSNIWRGVIAMKFTNVTECFGITNCFLVFSLASTASKKNVLNKS
jgi:hypothetical protein